MPPAMVASEKRLSIWASRIVISACAAAGSTAKEGLQVCRAARRARLGDPAGDAGCEARRVAPGEPGGRGGTVGTAHVGRWREQVLRHECTSVAPAEVGEVQKLDVELTKTAAKEDR